MPLDAQVRQLLDARVAAGLPPTNTLTPAQARAATRERVLRAALPPLPVAGVEERTIPGPGGPLRVRVYSPGGRTPLPALVYLHGGGWVICDLDTHDNQCRALAGAAGCVVVSVDYRLAPEHPWPAALDDADTAHAWTLGEAAGLGVDPARVGIGGDSAGGNLAAALCLRRRDAGGPPPAVQVLLYPPLDHRFDTASYRDNGEYLLSRDDMEWFWAHYLGDRGRGDHPLVSPLRAGDLAGLPAALVVTAEYDVLRDEAETYAERLRAAGVPVILRRYEGMIHGFLGQRGVVDRATQAVAEIGADLARMLTAPVPGAAIPGGASPPITQRTPA